jgi:hypothetical protein
MKRKKEEGEGERRKKKHNDRLASIDSLTSLLMYDSPKRSVIVFVILGVT